MRPKIWKYHHDDYDYDGSGGGGCDDDYGGVDDASKVDGQPSGGYWVKTPAKDVERGK